MQIQPVESEKWRVLIKMHVSNALPCTVNSYNYIDAVVKCAGYIFTDYNMVARAIQGFIAAWGQGHIAWGPNIFEPKLFFNPKFFNWPIFCDKNFWEPIFFSTKMVFYWPLAGHKSIYGPLSYLAGHIGIYGPLMEQSD